MEQTTGDPKVGMKYQEWELQEDGFVSVWCCVVLNSVLKEFLPEI